AVADDGSRPSVTGLRNAVITGWLQSNREVALQWLKTEGSNTPGRQALIREVIQTLARSDPDKALEFLTSAVNAQERDGMAREVVGGAIFTKGLDGTLPFVQKLVADPALSPAARNDAVMIYLNGCLRGYPTEF